MEFLGGSISDLKETLAGYKSTITVIITSISIDLGQLTLKQLEDYHRDIANTNSHLLSQLQSVGRRSLNQIGQQEKIREVEDAILCCIQACRKARTSIERVQREHLHDPVSAPEKGIATRKIWKMTENDFEYVRSFFLDSEAKLLSMKEQGDDQRSWLQHLNHCRSILEKKEAEVQQERTLRFENISSKDQAIQVIRSTAATPLWAKTSTLRPRASKSWVIVRRQQSRRLLRSTVLADVKMLKHHPVLSLVALGGEEEEMRCEYKQERPLGISLLKGNCGI
ncbi:hypothetical protein ALT_9502 [Aspergillus lentulus]|uniref:Azaphilone pigments biosynthesis cluster protein L N-terminal domain-containing protein n=1 Tax=Aspergillus lentulus TaxID=293939 RepID=A0AAN4PSY4_ASPLE|nr:hypothetical protein ALT_9502 [Aspergillus lentulus]